MIPGWRRKATKCEIGKERRVRHRYEGNGFRDDYWHERCIHCGATRRVPTRGGTWQYWETHAGR